MPRTMFACRLLIATVNLVCLSGLLHAEEKPADRGRATFGKFCVVCHGERGDGKAQGASALNPRPANLRTLTKRFGTFPADHIRSVIKGTDDVTSHSSAMRAWSAMLIASANGSDAEAARRLDDMVAFIQSIQDK
jgi:mono/diheme cytochrome c family protein